jgi:deoxyribodipyrimidine photolyase-related protein
MSVSIWVLGDQLIPNHPALEKAEEECDQEAINILMIESRALTQRYPYHAKKLILVFSAMRHYAEMLRQQGYHVDYRQAADFTIGLEGHIEDHHPERLLMMASINHDGHAYQLSLAEKLDCPVMIIDNTQFLHRRFDPFPDAKPEDFIRQETFYRQMRGHFNVLMTSADEPVGGKWNYDKQNRKPLPSDVVIPEILSFKPDRITQDVIEEIKADFDTIGDLDGFNLAVTHQEAEKAAIDFIENRLPYFGTYEDAMRQPEGVLFHSKLSPYINLGLLDPLRLAQMAEQAYFEGKAELNNVEGFIRQVIGWREYMAWQYHRLGSEIFEANFWGFDRELPAFFWSGGTSMNCLRHVLGRVLQDGFTHHIERLMVLSNFCLLAEIDPKHVFDWFSSLFIDAYDWVMVPNVYGMGLYADGGHVGTKPYIASANYINKMSDFCKDCEFNHRKRVGEGACPFNFLYWHFLIKHEKELKNNYRMARMLYNLKYLDEEERQAVVDQAERFLEF